MRTAIVFMVLAGAVLSASVPASAAPPALTGHGAITEPAANTGSLAEPVAKRSRARKSRRSRVRRCGWQCKAYWRPYTSTATGNTTTPMAAPSSKRAQISGARIAIRG